MARMRLGPVRVTMGEKGVSGQLSLWTCETAQEFHRGCRYHPGTCCRHTFDGNKAFDVWRRDGYRGQAPGITGVVHALVERLTSSSISRHAWFDAEARAGRSIVHYALR